MQKFNTIQELGKSAPKEVHKEVSEIVILHLKGVYDFLELTSEVNVILLDTHADLVASAISGIAVEGQEFSYCNYTKDRNFVCVAFTEKDICLGTENSTLYFIPMEVANAYDTVFDSIYMTNH